MSGLFQVKVKSIYLSQDGNPFYNMFGYIGNLTVIDEINALKNAFVDQVLDKILDVMHTGMEVTEVSVTEVNTEDYASVVFLSSEKTGTRSGDAMPKFTSWSFKWVKSTLGDRSGGKRIGVISESDVTGGIASGSIVTALNAAATAFASPLFEGILETWFPVILKRPPTPEDDWSSSPISGVQYTNVSTQNTRKR